MMKTEYRQSKGFTLVEVLVAMVIMAIGLLGLAGLQTLSLKDNQDAYLYSQATALAYEMSDRIKANSAFWQGAVPTPSCPAAKLCDSIVNQCSTAEIANFDYCYWKDSVAKKLVAGAGAVVTLSQGPGNGICSGNTSYRCLTISWTGSGKNSASLSYKLEVKP
jgi:type IV pilus assembly protein PilV